MGKKTGSAKQSKKDDPLEIECTINLGAKVLSDGGGGKTGGCAHTCAQLVRVAEKKRAPRAVREIKKFAQHQLGTKDVRVDVNLNKHLWSRGIRHVPNRVRLNLSRRVNEDEDAKEKMYTLVSYVNVPNGEFKGLLSKHVE